MVERRNRERRGDAPGSYIDVTRVEHENLYRQVEEILRMLRRMEAELNDLREQIQRVEGDLDALTVKFEPKRA